MNNKINLIALNFAFSIILKVTISLEATFHEFSKLSSEIIVVEKMMDSKARSRSFARISRANSFLCGSNTTFFD